MYNIKRKLVIAGHDVSEYVIVRAAAPAPSELTASEEIRTYVLRTTGFLLPVVCDSDEPRDCEIVVGETCRESEYTVERDKYGDDGYMIAVFGTRLVIAGAKKRGTMYGVYDFIEKYLGWRFYTAELEVLRAEGDIELPEGLTYEKIPVLEYRDLDWFCMRDRKIAAKLHLNGNYRRFGDEYGGELNWGGAIHSLGEYFPIDSYNEQPCLSDPANIKSAIEQIGKKLEEQPDLDLFEISQNDNQNYCKCERCTAIDEEEGNHAGTLIRFINALSDAFRDKYPKLHFQTFAYQYTRTPPKVTAPRDNVIIKLCPMECCPSHPLSDADCRSNVEFCSDLEGWKKVAKKIYIWDYVTNYAYFLAPFPNFEVQRLNIRFYADNNVKGLYPEGNYISPSGEFGELRAYLLAKLMWDPYMSKEEYYSEMYGFMEAYYGAGWKNILKYIEFTMKESEKVHCDIWSHPSIVIPFEVWSENLAWINDAWNAAEKEAGDKETLARVKRSRLQFTMLRLTLEYDARYTGADKESRKKYCTENQEFYNDLVRGGIAWREAYQFPIKTDFTKPPLEWCNPHTYGLPEED